jgi:hypothetical protein
MRTILIALRQCGCVIGAGRARHTFSGATAGGVEDLRKPRCQNITPTKGLLSRLEDDDLDDRARTHLDRNLERYVRQVIEMNVWRPTRTTLTMESGWTITTRVVGVGANRLLNPPQRLDYCPSKNNGSENGA